MNALPPLSLVDGAFLIDNSSLEHFQACRRFYELADIRHYCVSASRAGRNFGSAMHVGWKRRYLYGSNRPSSAHFETVLNDMREYFDANPPPTDDFRSFAHAERMMNAYLDFYGNEPFKILTTPSGEPFVERSFAFELGTVQNVPIVYTGRIDLALENNDGVWNLDHKTTFQYGSGFDDDMAVNGGQIGYVWATRKVLGTHTNGYIINGVRVRRPSKASKYVDSNGPDASVFNEDFKRMPFFVSDDCIEEWRTDVLALITDLFFNHDRGFFPKSRKACVTKYGRCDFYECCSAPIASRQSILDSSLFQINEWSPLNKTTNTTSESE